MAAKDPKITLKATDKTGKAFKSAQHNMRNLASSAAVLEGPLGGIAGRMNAVGAALGRVNPGILAAGVSVAALGTAMFKSTRIAIEFEVQMKSLEAVVQATGARAGFTAKNLNKIAEQTAKDTLASTTDARKAITILAQYRNIQGQTLEDALVAAQDISAAFGINLVRASQLLGRALNDPLLGIETLNTRTQIYSKTELAAARQTGEFNKTLETQNEILKRLKDTVGGLGVAQSETIAGKEDYTAQLHEELALQANLATYYGPAVELYNKGLQVVIGALKKRNDLERHILENGAETSARLKANYADNLKQKALDEKIATDKITAIELEKNLFSLKKELNEQDTIQNELRKSYSKYLSEKREEVSIEKELLALQTSTLGPRGKLGAEFAAKTATAGKGGTDEEQNALRLALQEKFFASLEELDAKDIQRYEQERARRIDIERNLTDEKGRIDINAREMARNLALDQIFSEEETQQKIIEIYQNAADKKSKIDGVAAKKHQNQLLSAANSAASIAQNTAQTLIAVGIAKDRKFRGIAAAEATVNTAVAATRAYRDLGPIAGPAAAAAIVAAGALQIANIYSASSTGATGAPVAPPTPIQQQEERFDTGPVVTVNVFGNFYGNDSFEDLIRDSVIDNISNNNVNLATESGEPILVNP